MDRACRLPPKWLLLFVVAAPLACDTALAPDPEPAHPCPPDCILTVDAPDAVAIARSVEVSARVTNLRDEPVPGVVVEWSLGLRLPCVRACHPTPYADVAEVDPAAGVTGADGRAVGTVIFPAEGDYLLTARIETDPAVQREIVASYPQGQSGQVEWTPVRSMPAAFQGLAAARIGTRIFLMAGHCDDSGKGDYCAGRDLPLAARYTDVYDVETDTWSVGAPPPPVAFDWHPVGAYGGPYDGSDLPAAAALNGVVHLIRGRAHHVYDPAADQWTESAPPPANSSQPRLEATAGRLFLIGTGESRRGVQTYDPVTGEWASAAPLPSGRGRTASAVVGGLIYVAGGGPGLSDRMERYDPATGSWESLPPMPLRRHYFAAGAVGRLFCVFGGGLHGDYVTRGLRETYCYDTTAGSWSLEPGMPWSRILLVAAAGDGQAVFAFGGGYNNYAVGMAQVADAARLSAR